MHYNYYFELCSLIFLILIAVAYYSRKKFPIPIFKIFGVCIGAVIINVSLNVTASILLNYQGIPVGVHEAINELYYFSQVFLSYLLFAYVFYGAGKSIKYSPQYFLTFLPTFIFACIIFSNSGHHLFFNLVQDAQGYYSVPHGKVYFLIYIISGLNILSTLIYLNHFRKVFSREAIYVMLSVVAVVVAENVLQFYFPKYLLAGVAYTISMIITIITVNDPDAKVDRISEAFNNDAFVEYINSQRFEGQRKYYIIFDVESFGMFNKMFGVMSANKLLYAVRKVVADINKNVYIFKTKSARFVVILKNRQEQIDMVKKIKITLASPLLVDEKKVNITIRLFYFVNDNVFRNSDSYNDFIARTSSLISFNDDNYIELDEDFINRLNRVRKIKEILENCLKDKIGLYMVYQPILDVKKNKFNHFEALIRLANTELGYVGPGEFIPIAEESGLANDIDNFVFEETCAFLARNPDIEILEINVSCAEFFNNPSARFINTIEKYKIDPRRICLEITETVAVKYPEKTEDFMRDLGKYGVQFAMDDFGSGYSNIARFITLPFSIAKLDKTLLTDSERISIFFDSAINLFKTLNIPIVIEGVENEKQLKLVKEKEIDYIQGYYFSKPIEEDELRAFLDKHN